MSSRASSTRPARPQAFRAALTQYLAVLAVLVELELVLVLVLVLFFVVFVVEGRGSVFRLLNHGMHQAWTTGE